MSRTIDAIIKEVSSRSDPQRQTIMQQVADIPRQIEAETAGLQAKRLQANDEILGSAQDRGVGFGGIPIGEQAKYAATEFAPALARLQTAGVDRKTSLEQALAGIGSQDYSVAQDIFRDERDFAENARRFELQQQEAARSRAASAASEQSILAKYGIDLNNLGGNQLSSGFVDPEAAARAAWEADQLRVSTSAPRRPQLSASRLQGSGGSLQGGRSGQGSSLSLQGNRSTGNLRLPAPQRRSGLSVNNSPSRSRLTVR